MDDQLFLTGILHPFSHIPDSSLTYIVSSDFQSDHQFSLLQFLCPLGQENSSETDSGTHRAIF